MKYIYHYIDQQGQEKLGAVPPELATSECNDCAARVDSASTSFSPLPAPQFESTSGTDEILVQNIAPEVKSPYYIFEIGSFGWFNLDQFLKETNICKSAKLHVQIKGQQQGESISLSLIIPYYKINQQGWLLSDGKTMGFAEQDEEILLPVGTTAYLMAVGMGADEKSFSYSLTKFTTSKQQSLTVELRASDKQDILKSMRIFKLSADIRKNDTIVTDTTAVRYSRLDSLCNCYPWPVEASVLK